MNNLRLDPIVRGDPRTIAVQVRDPDGNTVDISGSNWSAQAREKPGSEEYETLAVDATGATSGVLKLSLTGEQTRKFCQTLHGDLEADNIGTLFSWRHIVSNDVTRRKVGGAIAEPTGGFVDVVEVVLGDQGANVSESVRAVVLGGFQLPTGAADGDIVVWDADTNRWVFTANRADAIFQRVRATEPIRAGQVVARVAWQSGENIPTARLGVRGDTSLGIAAEDIAVNEIGSVLWSGHLIGVDTSDFALNDLLFLGDTPGALTTTAAGLPVARVARVNTNNGVMMVFGERPAIDDTTTSAGFLWSSAKISGLIEGHIASDNPHPNIVSTVDHIAIATAALDAAVPQLDTVSTTDHAAIAAANLV